MIKVKGKTKDFGDVHDAWERLLENIGPDGNDFVIFSIKRRKEIGYFHARAEGQHIVVDRAEGHIETSKINGERRMDFNQFRCVAKYYNDYVCGIKGIRPKMIDSCGFNTSYIISLIHYLL
jgi:hypothetical protein